VVLLDDKDDDDDDDDDDDFMTLTGESVNNMVASLPALRESLEFRVAAATIGLSEGGGVVLNVNGDDDDDDDDGVGVITRAATEAESGWVGLSVKDDAR
jgi:hypothetical protein